MPKAKQDKKRRIGYHGEGYNPQHQAFKKKKKREEIKKAFKKKLADISKKALATAKKSGKAFVEDQRRKSTEFKAGYGLTPSNKKGKKSLRKGTRKKDEKPGFGF